MVCHAPSALSPRERYGYVKPKAYSASRPQLFLQVLWRKRVLITKAEAIENMRSFQVVHESCAVKFVIYLEFSISPGT